MDCSGGWVVSCSRCLRRIAAARAFSASRRAPHAASRRPSPASGRSQPCGPGQRSPGTRLRRLARARDRRQTPSTGAHAARLGGESILITVREASRSWRSVRARPSHRRGTAEVTHGGSQSGRQHVGTPEAVGYRNMPGRGACRLTFFRPHLPATILPAASPDTSLTNQALLKPSGVTISNVRRRARGFGVCRLPEEDDS
jgi:hypothetical protein